MKKSLLTALLALILLVTQAQSINYSEHIAPIIYGHCTNCHRPGEIGPFPLTSYSEVNSWATMIKQVTGIHYMPPWKPEVGYQQYQKENHLTDAEVQLISDWVTAGTPQGNPALEPPLPVYPTGSQLGIPSKVVSFSQSYTHVGNNTDEYRYFVIPTGLTRDADLIGLELRPGNKKIVHHALAWEDTSGAARAADSAAPGYGYPGSAGSTLAGINGQLPGYVPGQKPILWTNGIAQKIHKNADLKVQIHYAPTASDEQDSTSINLFFAQQPATRLLKSKVMVPLPGVLVNGPFIIPANQIKDFHGTWTVPEEASVAAIAPHCHNLGQNWRVYAITPNGDSINLIKINEWDFNWQGAYYFKKLIHLPINTVIHAWAKYDNTTSNPKNPNNPPKTLSFGENTKDEMYYLPITYLSYQPGDENIVFEGNSTAINDSRFYSVQNKLYPIAPNPARGSIKVGFTLADGNIITLKLYNANGQLVTTPIDSKYYLQGLHNQDLDLSRLTEGIYTLSLDIKGVIQSQRIVVCK